MAKTTGFYVLSRIKNVSARHSGNNVEKVSVPIDDIGPIAQLAGGKPVSLVTYLHSGEQVTCIGTPATLSAGIFAERQAVAELLD